MDSLCVLLRHCKTSDGLHSSSICEIHPQERGEDLKSCLCRAIPDHNLRGKGGSTTTTQPKPGEVDHSADHYEGIMAAPVAWTLAKAIILHGCFRVPVGIV